MFGIARSREAARRQADGSSIVRLARLCGVRSRETVEKIVDAPVLLNDDDDVLDDRRSGR